MDPSCSAPTKPQKRPRIFCCRQCRTPKKLGWLLDICKNLAAHDRELTYEIATDATGRPIGIWWRTGAMRKAWIRYGDSIYLDRMKRQMNEFHWPYIGPVVLTSEMQVQVVCESIIIEESLPSYAFVLNNLFKHGSRRPKESLRLIFGDYVNRWTT